jgi:hypothetical protein
MEAKIQQHNLAEFSRAVRRISQAASCRTGRQENSRITAQSMSFADLAQH